MNQWFYAINGQQRGPVSEEEIKALIAQGIVKPSDFVWSDGMQNWSNVLSIFPENFQQQSPPPPGAVQGYSPVPLPGYPTSAPLAPHRGTMILVFGIIGIACCIIFGIVAWVMGNNDLREMREGRMDPSGQSTTNAGRICGMVSVILAIVGVIFQLGFYAIKGSRHFKTF